MAASFIDAIGLVSGVLGIASFFQDNLPSSDPAGAHVQIKVGLGETGDSGNVAGGIEGVYAYDFNNEYIGRQDGGFIDRGGTLDVVVDQNTPGVQTDFLSINGVTDAVCISWISLTQNDGSTGGAWTGDVGRECGDYWYHGGNQLAGEYKEGGEWRPVCAWLDEDHSANYPYCAMKFNIHAYGELVQQTVDEGLQCESTLWASDCGPINDKPAKRSNEHRPAWMEAQLIMSNHSSQTAAELCHDPKSWGPDFVGADGQYCDMQSKSLAPLCSTESVHGCVDMDHNAKTVHKRTTIARRAVEHRSLHKSYDTIVRWG